MDNIEHFSDKAYRIIYIYIYIQMGKKEQRNITSLTTSFANAFQVN